MIFISFSVEIGCTVKRNIVNYFGFGFSIAHDVILKHTQLEGGNMAYIRDDL